MVQLHVTKNGNDKEGDKHCVAYYGDSARDRDNFQYAKVKLKLVEDSEQTNITTTAQWDIPTFIESWYTKKKL